MAEAHTYFVGEPAVWVHNQGCDAISKVAQENNIPEDSLTTNQADVFEHLNKHTKIPKTKLSKKLHKLKDRMADFGGDTDMVFDRSGSVYNPKTGEHVGELTVE